MDLQAPGLTLPILGPLFIMSPGDRGLFLSMSTFGLIFGAAVGGRMSDRIGRKPVLIASVTLFGLFTVATTFSSGVAWLFATRFLTGIGLGGALPNVIALVSECVTLERRSTAVGFLYASLPVGGATASLVTAVASAKDQWGLVYLLGGIAPLLTVPLLIMVLPRSPVSEHSPKSGSGIVSALFGDKRARLTLLVWAGFFFALLTMYLLLGWLPSLMVRRGLSRSEASTVQLAFNVFGALGSVLTGFLLDRERRTFTVVSIFALALLAIATLAMIPAEFSLALMAGGLIGATVSGCQTVMYALAPSCYPTPVRGTGVGAAVAVGRLGSAAGPLLAGILLGSGRSPTEVLTALLPLLFASGIAATLVSSAMNKSKPTM
jgi:MFS transporter, AAHS family, 3-hydroxyphenylpropionic acid transporter